MQVSEEQLSAFEARMKRKAEQELEEKADALIADLREAGNSFALKIPREVILERLRTNLDPLTGEPA